MWQRWLAKWSLVALLPGLVPGAGVLVRTACAETAPEAVSEVEFSLKQVGGDNFRLSEHRGEIVLLGFWAGWCGDCRAAMQSFSDLHEKYANAGVTVLGVNVGDSFDQTAAMARGLQLRFPVLVDEQKTVNTQFYLKKMPLVILIDRDGKVRYSHAGYERGDENLVAARVRALINE